MKVGNCRGKKTYIFSIYKQVLKSHGPVSNNSIATFFITVGDMILAKNDAYGNKEHELMIPGPKQEKLVPGH